MDIFFGYATALDYLRLPAMDRASERHTPWPADEAGGRFENASVPRVNRNTRDYVRDSLKPSGWPSWRWARYVHEFAGVLLCANGPLA